MLVRLQSKETHTALAECKLVLATMESNLEKFLKEFFKKIELPFNPANSITGYIPKGK